MRSSRVMFALIALLATGTQAQQPAQSWTRQSLSQLRSWVSAAPDDALPRPDSSALERAIAGDNPAKVDQAASDLALRLAQMHLLGASSAAERAGWGIADTDRSIDLRGQLAVALAAGRIDDFFAGQRPQHPDYTILRDAYRAETDPAKKQVIGHNMERWRWMPLALGQDYLLVNTAAFEAVRWRGGQRLGTWRVITGKVSSPTPVFSAMVTGVNLNPWWNVPSNIVRESVGSLIRRSPATARARGYVWSGGSVRQKPGPQNALGRMKLVMPNRYSVYLHDTPSRDLFDREVRAFSHGCVRVGDALGLAENLLQGTRTRAEIDAIVASNRSVTISLAQPIPVYIAYFTAGTKADGTFAMFPDIYGRDKRMARLARGGLADCSSVRGRA